MAHAQAAGLDKTEDRSDGFGTSGQKRADSRSAVEGTSRSAVLGTSRVLISAPQEVPDPAPLKSNTDMNHTEYNHIESDQSIPAENDEIRCEESTTTREEAYEQVILENIAYDDLLTAHPEDRDLIEGITALILETVLSEGETIVIASNRYSAAVVKARFLKLSYSHIDYVLFCLKRNTSKVRNIRKYLLAALFNAPSTIGSYYQAEVNHGMSMLPEAQ